MLLVPTTHKLEVIRQAPDIHEPSCRVSEEDIVVEVVRLPAGIKIVSSAGKRASIRSASPIRGDEVLERHLNGDEACVWIGQADESDHYAGESCDLPAAIVPMNFPLIRAEGLHWHLHVGFDPVELGKGMLHTDVAQCGFWRCAEPQIARPDYCSGRGHGFFH